MKIISMLPDIIFSGTYIRNRFVCLHHAYYMRNVLRADIVYIRRPHVIYGNSL